MPGRPGPSSIQFCTARSTTRSSSSTSPYSSGCSLRKPLETALVNSIGTNNLLDLARRHSASFLLASTSEAYGDPQVNPQAEDYWGNVNPVGVRSCYDEGKRFAEALTMVYVRQ